MAAELPTRAGPPGGPRPAENGTAWFELAGGERLQLWPERLAHDPARQLLLVADAHFGKAGAFRRAGLPVPEATTDDAIARLEAVVAATGARRLAFLGDLLHAPGVQQGPALRRLAQWRAARPAMEWLLVRGNHDRHAGDPPPGLGLQVVDGPWRIGPWALVHEPQVVQGAYALAGHVHPGIRLRGRALDRLRLPCFLLGQDVGLLPAFGAFTGLHEPPLARGDRCYPIAEGRVLSLPPVDS